MALMAKRVRRPSDPTVAASLDGGRTVAAPLEAGQTVAASLGGGETSVVPNSTPTNKVELAWSTGDVLGDDDLRDIPVEEPHAAVVGQSWSATLRIAGLLVVAGLVLAGAIVLGRWVLTSEKTPTKAAPPQGATSTAPASSATSAAPVSIISTPDQDNRFIQDLGDRHISFGDRTLDITNGKVVCQDLAARMTVPQIVQEFRNNFPSLSDKADEFVNISISAYCPQ